MSRRHRSRFHEPSLVPLADMLSNTVGIMVFILIFIVLTAGGALLPKRLPIEHEVSGERAIFVCYQGHILPLNEDSLGQKFMEMFRQDEGIISSQEGLQQWLSTHKAEDEYMTMTVEVTFFLYSASETTYFMPKSGAGDTEANLEKPDSVYYQFLQSHDPKKRFIYFLVYTDSLDTFTTAREVARKMHYETGWSPHSGDGPMPFGAGGRETIGL